MKPASYDPSFPLPSLVCHLNLTGFKDFTKSKPRSRAFISVLSLLSDKELIVCTLQRKVAILESPKVISLSTSAALAVASWPIIILLSPTVRLFVPVSAASCPIITFLEPVLKSLALPLPIHTFSVEEVASSPYHDPLKYYHYL